LLQRLGRYWLRLKGWRTFGKSVAIFGDFTVIHPENVSIGSNCAINHGVFLLGRCGIEIGNDVVLSARCMILDAGLDPGSFAEAKERRYVDAAVKVGDGCWIGAGAIILPGVSIGPRSVVGAGAVVTRDVPPDSIVGGNPARMIGRTGGGGAVE